MSESSFRVIVLQPLFIYSYFELYVEYKDEICSALLIQQETVYISYYFGVIVKGGTYKTGGIY